MKYIVIDDNGMEIPIIFPSIIQHHRILPENGKIVSAGDVDIFTIISGADDTTISEIQVCCSGKSISLDVVSRLKIDENLIKRSFNY